MKWSHIKTVIIHLLGAVFGFISFYGLHPFSVGYLAAVLMETPYRLSVAGVTLFGILLASGFMKLIKYGLIMVSILFVTKFLEVKWNLKGRWCVSLVTGFSVFIVGWIGDGIMATSFAEGILVFASSVIFTYIPFNKNLSSSLDGNNELNSDPRETRLFESAEVFSRLSQCFQDLGFRKNGFNKSELERMSESVYQDFCSKCLKAEDCWKKNNLDTVATCSNLLEQLQEGRSLSTAMVRGRLRSQCIKLHGFLNALTDSFSHAQINLFWYNRLIEHREAVADQLDEMANMIAVVAEEVYEKDDVDEDLEEALKFAFKDIRLKLDKLSVNERKDGRQEFYITGHANNTKYVNVKEMAGVLSRIIGKEMVASKDSKSFVTEIPATILFVDKPVFTCMCKAARVIKPGQSVSGDNYMFTESNDGQAFACISDGMGSGVSANRESETVVELMERFIDAGFSKETAVKMINSTMVLTDGEPSCSTVDICSVNLYEGYCDFIKLGAAPSFIKRDYVVDCIESDMVPVGVLSSPDYGTKRIDVEDGDFIIMVSDGILEALVTRTRLEYLIRKQESVNPSEIANNILAGALSACGYNPEDDMTVLVIGIWK